MLMRLLSTYSVNGSLKTDPSVAMYLDDSLQLGAEY